MVEAKPGRRIHSAFALLVVAYALLFTLPSELALVGPLKSNGAPVRLLGLVAMVLVVAAALQWRGGRAVRPIAAVLLIHLALELAVWGASNRGGGIVGAGAFADRSLLRTVSAVGLAVLCALLVHTLAQAHVLSGVLIAGLSVSCVAGVLQQFGLITSWADVVALPFTTTVASPGGTGSRGELLRVSGSAAHPIEFAVGIAMLLPLALHLSLFALSPRGRAWSRAALALAAVCFPMGVSRGGLVTLVVSMSVYSIFLSARARAGLLAGSTVALATMVVAAPRVTETFTQIITGASDDDSIQGRLGDYPTAFAQIAAAPWLGGASAGPGGNSTVLDNQWLGTLVRSGVLGVASLVVLFLGVVVVAGMAGRKRAPVSSAATRSLNGAVAAGVAGAAFAAGTFDFLSFQQVAFAVLLLAGLVGVSDERVGGGGRSAGRGVVVASSARL